MQLTAAVAVQIALVGFTVGLPVGAVLTMTIFRRYWR